MDRNTYDDACKRLTAVSDSIGEILGTAENPREETLSDEDKSALDILEAESTELSDTKTKYEVDQKDLQERLARQTALQAELKKPKPRSTTPAVSVPAESLDKPPKMPAIPLGPSKLRAFKGEDARENAYKSGLFLLATNGNNWAAQTLDAFGVKLANVQTEGSNVHGGYLVFPEFERAIIDLKEEYGVARQFANVVSMGSDTQTIPRRVGGLTVYYPAEGAEITQSDAEWDQVTLTAMKMAIMARYSTELNEDAIISMADKLAAEMAYAFTEAEDEAMFNGDGTATYGGVTGILSKINDGNHDGSVLTLAAADLAFSDIIIGDMEEVVGMLPQYAENGAAWYMSKAGFAASFMRLMDAAGGNTGDMLAGGKMLQFLGYPVRVSQVLNSTLTDQASTNLFCFGNLAMAAMIGDRRGVTVKTSEHRYIELDQVAIQSTQRVAVNVHELGTGSVCGPMVVIETPAE